MDTLQAIQGQKAFLDYVASELEGLGSGKTDDWKMIMAVVKTELASVREQLEVRNEWWENSEQLKTLEHKLTTLGATVNVCGHSLGGGPPIHIEPGQEHHCVNCAASGSIPGLCNCEAASISRAEFVHRSHVHSLRP